MSRGYRSATEYHFRQEQADAIVRVTAYHRQDFCRSVIWFPPREHVGIRQSISSPFQRDPHTGLGSLDRLPLELLYDVMSQLDIRSLFRFRQTSLSARIAVDSLNQYQMVVSHGLNLLCALLRTRLASIVSLSEFYDALCARDCAICGDFGGFISLLTWTRCCFPCLQGAPDLQVQTLAYVRRQIRSSKAKVDQLRSFSSLPGTYTMNETRLKSRVQLASIPRGYAMISTQLNPARHQKYNFMGSCALPYYDNRSGRVEHGMSCAGCQLALEKDIIGYRGETWAFKARDKVYAQDGFLEHFRWCEQAQLLWRTSDEGNKRPPELPEAARRRGFFRNRE